MQGRWAHGTGQPAGGWPAQLFWAAPLRQVDKDQLGTGSRGSTPGRGEQRPDRAWTRVVEQRGGQNGQEHVTSLLRASVSPPVLVITVPTS